MKHMPRFIGIYSFSDLIITIGLQFPAAVPKKKPILCILRGVHFQNHSGTDYSYVATKAITPSQAGIISPVLKNNLTGNI